MKKLTVLMIGGFVLGVGLGLILLSVVMVPWEMQSVSMWDYGNPEAYISKDNRKYTYQGTYPDGSQMTYQVLSIRVKGGPLLTQVNVSPESQPYAYHYVNREKGIYTIWEADPSNVFLYLPSDLRVGSTWEDGEVRGRVMKTGETVEMGWAEFKDCILVQKTYSDTGYVFRVWYAPGIGLIRSEYGDTGSPHETLLKIEPLGIWDRIRSLIMVPEAANIQSRTIPMNALAAELRAGVPEYAMATVRLGGVCRVLT